MRDSLPLRLLAFAVLVATALPAFAYRRAYNVTWEGRRHAGSQVCFYRGQSTDAPFTLFFAFTRVGCLPADEVLDFPPGLYHAFARNVLTGHVSAHRDYFIYPEPARPEQGYEELDVPLTRGGTVDFTHARKTLSPGQSLGVWLAPTASAGATYFPLVDGEDTLLVPAEMPFVPLLVERGMPIAIGDAVELSAGERISVRGFPRAAGRGDVMAWVSVDLTSLQPPGAVEATPEVSVSAGGETFLPLFPLTRTTGDARNTLLFFRGVPAGKARLKIGGLLWAEEEREIAVSDGATTVEAAPLLLSARGAVTVTWDLGTPAPPADRCSARSIPRPPIRASLARCDAAGSCGTAAETSGPFGPAGSLVLKGLQPGMYVLIVQPPFSDSIRIPAVVQLGTALRLSLPLEPFRFHGKLRLNGKPVEGRLLFYSGEAYSDQSGHYQAAVATDPLTNLVRIVLCEGGKALTYIPKKPIERNSVYDIYLQLAFLVVRVADETGAPVARASVRYLPVKEVLPTGPVFFYSSKASLTGEDGSVAFDDVPGDSQVQICAAHPDFSDTCTAPVSREHFKDRGVVVSMKRPALRGRIEGHQGWGVLAFVSGTRVVEEVQLASDGTFTMKSVHLDPEHVVYVSERAPLTVFTLPIRTGESPELVLTPPAAPVRSFTVRAGATQREPGFVGLWIGEHYVPLNVLAYHQDARGGDVVVSSGRPLVIRQIAATQALSVAFARRDARAAVFVDPFTQPEFAGVRRTPVMRDAVHLEP